MLKTHLSLDGTIDFSMAYQTIDSLPVGVYIPKYTQNRGVYLTPSPPFKYLPEYYLLDNFEEYVLRSFNSGNKSQGVIYTGLKGSGKTKRAHKLALDSGLPIIHLSGGDLTTILKDPSWVDIRNSSTFNNVVIILDEYEKYLDEDPVVTVHLLDWLDGSCDNKQLFILIGNEKANTKFSDPLNDRLSRILWKKNFSSLKENEIEKLVKQLSIRNDKEDLIESISNIPIISLDNALQIIKTTNLFPDNSPEDIISMLNIEFSPYDIFYLCDENYENVYYDEISLSLKKNTIIFEKAYLNASFLPSMTAKLKSLNPDIDENDNVFISRNLEELNINIINKDKISIQVPYWYTSLESGEETESKDSITLFLVKLDFFQKIKDKKSRISFNQIK